MRFLYIVLASTLLLASCAKTNSAPGQHATVVLKDGSQVGGIVAASSPSEVTLNGDDNTTHTIPTAQISSMTYDQAPAPPQANGLNPAPVGQMAQAPPAGSPAYAPLPPPHENHYHPEFSEIRTKTFVVPSGTQVSVRVEETIDSATAAEGQTYAAEVVGDVLDSDGAVVIPRGSNSKVIIRSASRGSRFRGTSDLILDIATISVGGRQYTVSTTDLAKSGKQGFGGNKRTAEYTGGGAAFGAIIGAIAGHGKGAAIGAASGAGAGALTQVLTKGGSVRVPVETILNFRLDQPLRITESH